MIHLQHPRETFGDEARATVGESHWAALKPKNPKHASLKPIYIFQKTALRNQRYVYISLFYLGSEEAIAEGMWHPGQPDGHQNQQCVWARLTWLGDNDCGVQHNYICEIN